VKGLDLIHLDAHMDFGFHPARPVVNIMEEARSVRELKERLEYTLAFLRYEKDFDKQTDVGNYIYPAMAEGIVKDFYWVVPGGKSELRKSAKGIKSCLKRIMKYGGGKACRVEDRRGMIVSGCLGRRIIVCTLDSLPVLSAPVLLDIDTDFLVIESTEKAEATTDVGRRKPWILPRDLVAALAGKVRRPYITTIAYSVNGGWTPMEYKVLGDELAYRFSPSRFRARHNRMAAAAESFILFNRTGKSEYYRRSVRLNPGYRAADNNYGPLFLAAGKTRRAYMEFNRILKADRYNPAALLGLGVVALERKEYKAAAKHMRQALAYSAGDRSFRKIWEDALLFLSIAELNLKRSAGAKRRLLTYGRLRPLEPRCPYYLGTIFEREGDFVRAAELYKDAVRLGFNGIEPLERLIKICGKLTEKSDIIGYVASKYKEFTRACKATKDRSLRRRMSALETRIERERGEYD